VDLAALRQEVFDRGFDYVSPTRVAYWLNRVYHRACEREPWPFLQATTTGVSPLAISDVRSVLSVVDTTSGSPVVWRDQRTILEEDPNLESTGTPDYWYLASGSLTVYPVNTTDTISVVYTKVPSDLSSDSDIPLIPTRYHYLLVDGACAHAYEDSDNFEAAANAWNSYFQAIEEMANTLMVEGYDNPNEIVIRGSIDW